MEAQIEAGGLTVNFAETGIKNGKPVVIMHGWGCSHETTRSIARILEKDHRVINVDLPGHGKSEEPSSIWGVEDFTECIRELIEKLDIKKPSLIGHSFGGRISILYSSRYDTDRVVLVDSAGIKPKRSLKYYGKVYSFKALKNVLKLFYKGQEYEKKIEKLRSKRGSADYKNSTPVMRGIMSRCVNEDLKKYMESIKSPVLLVWGENDTATPLRDAQIMNKLIPDSGLVSFKGCGHYSFLDNPYGFSAVIKEFFKNQ